MIKFFHYETKTKIEEVYKENGEVDVDENGEVKTKEVKDTPNVFFDIVDNEDNIIVKYKFKEDEEFKEITVLKEYGKCYDLVDVRVDKEHIARLLPVYSKITFINYSTGISIPNTTIKVARIVFDNDIIIYSYMNCDDIEGIENVTPDNTKTMTGNIIANSEYVSNIFPKLEKKGRLLADIDYYKSLAYLEAQVDLLTRIVLNTSNNEKLLEVLKCADDNSVLNIKPLDNIKEEFTNGKNTLRNKQEEYYGKIIK